ncbi:GPI transamidase component [Didymosphaeria variabile]|uniref:GPI transamidase component n=1 Tax=Didymosphaeria variabile TaxID=1932322 RepID=A0A9W9CE85_9PLEO|nr:GPI transamidase component [Didymosphaeria variabile]KAJ4358506.1 GPI transamidase component [Didymosphaeria variabile]
MAQTARPPETTTMASTNEEPKQPPPETPQSLWLRRAVIASFWAVVAFLGLPVWWRTTAIYRAELPLQDMMSWANAQVGTPVKAAFTPLTSTQECKLVFPLHIAVEAPLPSHDVHHLLEATQNALNDLNSFPAHQLRLAFAEPPPPANASQQVIVDGTGPAKEDDTAALSVRLIPVETGATPRSRLQPYSTNLDVYFSPNQIPLQSSTSSPLATYIAGELHQLYAQEQAQLANLISDASYRSRSASPDVAAQLQRQSARAFKYAPTYHLTFSLFTPTSTPSAWDIDAALRQYMRPILESFSGISNFTIDTQVQLYAGFSPSIRQPEYDDNAKAWTIYKEDVSGFINAAEWPLSPSIGQGPTINFALYVPDEGQAPLLVQGSRDNSWLIPQWGGVMILNPQSRDPTLTKEALVPAMQVFSTQLTSLLGLPQTPASLPLRISTLIRVHAASLIFSSSSTLGALAQVYQKMPTIPVPDSVAKSVDLSLAHLNQACESLREGRFQDALENARTANGEAEKAFFERSMVGQVYFPDEHKVAVYLPLLGPVAVPLVMAALKEVKAGIAALKGR